MSYNKSDYIISLKNKISDTELRKKLEKYLRSGKLVEMKYSDNYLIPSQILKSPFQIKKMLLFNIAETMEQWK